MDIAPTVAELTPTQRHVLLVLCDNMDDNTGLAWPSIRTLARRTGLHPRSVQRALHDLVDHDLIAPCHDAHGAGPGRTIRYRRVGDPLDHLRSTPVQKPVDNR